MATIIIMKKNTVVNMTDSTIPLTGKYIYTYKSNVVLDTIRCAFRL